MSDRPSPEPVPPTTLDPEKPTHPQVLRTEETDTGYRLHLLVSTTLGYLDGHFPHVPIVAGVCQLKWVIDYIEAYIGQPLHITAMESVKFQRPLFPPQHFAIEFAFDAQTPAWQYRVFSETQQFAAGRLIVQS